MFGLERESWKLLGSCLIECGRGVLCRGMGSYLGILIMGSLRRRWRCYQICRWPSGCLPELCDLVQCSSISGLEALASGEWVHLYAEGNEIEIDDVLGLHFVDMYSKCGSFEKAVQLFNGLQQKNVVMRGIQSKYIQICDDCHSSMKEEAWAGDARRIIGGITVVAFGIRLHAAIRLIITSWPCSPSRSCSDPNAKSATRSNPYACSCSAPYSIPVPSPESPPPIPMPVLAPLPDPIPVPARELNLIHPLQCPLPTHL